MTNMKKMFHATRIPQNDIDVLKSYPDSKHILIQRGTNFYIFDVLDDNGDIVDENLIAKNIDYILHQEEFDDTGPGLGALTLWDRTNWSNTRERFVNTLNNQNVMEMIDSALFAVCLEDDIPKSESDQLLRMLTGSNGKNRWHDKSFQIVVRRDGVSCMTFEHSWGDGVAVLSYLTEVYDHVMKTKVNIDSNNNQNNTTTTTVEKLTFNTDEELVKDTIKAENFVKDFVASLDGPDSNTVKLSNEVNIEPEKLKMRSLQSKDEDLQTRIVNLYRYFDEDSFLQEISSKIDDLQINDQIDTDLEDNVGKKISFTLVDNFKIDDKNCKKLVFSEPVKLSNIDEGTTITLDLCKVNENYELTSINFQK